MAILGIERSILLAGATAFLFALGGQAALADDDNDRAAKLRHVDCDDSDGGLQNEIDRIKHGTPTTIVVEGTCKEDIRVTKDDLTLAGDEDDGTIEGSIDVIGAQRVTIEGLNVIGGIDTSAAFTARDNASVTINYAEIQSKNADFFAVLATRSASVVMTYTQVEATDKAKCAVYINDGSVLRMNGGNTLISDDKGYNCATLTLVRNATARIRGSGNTITNKGGMGQGDPSTRPLGVALDSGALSSLRIDPTMEDDAVVIKGDVASFNLSSIDLRKVVVNGDIFADGLNANIRLRGNNFGDVIVYGDVFCSNDSAVTIRGNGRVIINGNIFNC